MLVLSKPSQLRPGIKNLEDVDEKATLIMGKTGLFVRLELSGRDGASGKTFAVDFALNSTTAAKKEQEKEKNLLALVAGRKPSLVENELHKFPVKVM